jgi:hypothetical protein
MSNASRNAFCLPLLKTFDNLTNCKLCHFHLGALLFCVVVFYGGEACLLLSSFSSLMVSCMLTSSGGDNFARVRMSRRFLGPFYCLCQ